MNLLLVATRSRAAAWISPARHQLRTTTSGSWCQSSRPPQHSHAYGTLVSLHGLLSLSSPQLLSAEARRDGWRFRTTNIQRQRSPRSDSSIVTACAMMSSTSASGADGGGMKKKNTGRHEHDDDCQEGSIDSMFSRGDKILVEVISFGPMVCFFQNVFLGSF
jgi:hypothetical protein